MNRLCFNRVWRPQWKTRTQTFQKCPHPPSQVLKETIVHCWTSCTSPDSLTSDLALMSMLQTFLSFLVFPAASSCRLAYFSSMSILSCCKKEKPVIPVHYYTMYLTNNYTLCSSLLLWFFFYPNQNTTDWMLLITTYKPFPNVSLSAILLNQSVFQPLSDVYQVERINCIYL